VTGEPENDDPATRADTTHATNAGASRSSAPSTTPTEPTTPSYAERSASSNGEPSTESPSAATAAGAGTSTATSTRTGTAIATGAEARAIPTWRRTLLAGALFAGAWLYVFPHYPQLNNPNENVRVYMTAALVEEGGYEISRFRARWGWTNDAACVDHAPDGTLAPCSGRTEREHHRRYYSVKAPLASWMAVPGYAIARALRDAPMQRDDGLWWMRLFASGLPMLAFFVFFHRWLGARVRSPVVRDATFVATALGSVLLGYSWMLASHSTSAASAFLSFALLFDAHRVHRTATTRGHETSRLAAHAWWRVLFAGLFATATTALEYPCFFVTLALCVYALVALRPVARQGDEPRERGFARLRFLGRLVVFGVGALVPVLVVMHFQASAFGSPFSPGHLYVETEGLRAGHESGFFGADAFRLDAAWKLLFHPRLGLFATTPFFAFAIFGVVVAWRRARVPTAVALFACTTTYLVICLMNNWEGGWVIGPRYLVVTLPFVAVASALALDELARRRRTAAHVLALGATAASLVTGGIPSLYPHVPPDLDWPLADLFPALLEAGRAPDNPLLAWGAPPAMSLLPLAAIAIAAWVFASQRARDRKTLALSAAFAITLVAPQILAAPDRTPAVDQTVSYIVEHWD
jgi:hypothetical protein